MGLPVIRGVIERRILVNYRVDPQRLASLVPAPFRPKTIRGRGFVGICLIRLSGVRPSFLPQWCGLRSENAAHRTAVEWDENGSIREGVYVRRRDTDSWLNTLAGGRVFPGIQHHASFTVNETEDNFHIAMKSDDGETSMLVRGHRVEKLSSRSLFESLQEASSFFQTGSLGYSDASVASRFQGMELRCQNWEVEPLEVDEVHSSFFDNETFFPKGSIEFDCALLMRNIVHEWRSHADLCCPSL